MSGWTSNVTEIMATTMVATSALPIAFGISSSSALTSLCQTMYFMAGSTDGNPEMSQFLDSMSMCSYTNPGNSSSNSSGTTTSGNATASGRRLTAITYTDSFLTTAMPIFIIMGCFVSAYIVVLLFQKYG